MNHCRIAGALSCILLPFVMIAIPMVCAPADAGAGPLASGDPTVSFSSLGQCVEPGALCTLRVMVDQAVDSLSCMEIDIRYDTAYAACTGALEGKLYKQAGYPTFFQWRMIPPDTVEAVDCVLGYRSYFLAPGELVRFVFKAKKPGVCAVSFASIRLWDIDRIELAPLAGENAEIVVCGSTGDDVPDPRPGALSNYPNPFNPSTVFTLWLPNADGRHERSEVALDIFSVSGEKVRSLFAGTLPSGIHEILWDGKGDRGAAAPAGVYFAVAETAGGMLMRKIVLIR